LPVTKINLAYSNHLPVAKINLAYSNHLPVAKINLAYKSLACSKNKLCLEITCL
jgi:hypothetical protein